MLAGLNGKPGRKKTVPQNSKGCDIGYALAANSCEGVNRVDACTVTAFDAIAAFAAPDPDSSSQSPSVFSGPGVRRIASPDESLSLLRTGCRFIEANPFDRRREPS